ncbi:MAG: flavodoxin family protein [bacterium]|nr:flavodoxin family protein [bacterium]
MQILILYQSRKGYTRQTAKVIAEVAQKLGHSVTIKSVIEAQQSHIEQADLLFIGTWIQGFILFGVKPAGADLWVPALPTLTGKPIAIFCTYTFNPRQSLDKLGNLLRAKGATIVSQQAFRNGHLGDGVEAFVKHTLSLHT